MSQGNEGKMPKISKGSERSAVEDGWAIVTKYKRLALSLG